MRIILATAFTLVLIGASRENLEHEILQKLNHYTKNPVNSDLSKLWHAERYWCDFLSDSLVKESCSTALYDLSVAKDLLDVNRQYLTLDSDYSTDDNSFAEALLLDHIVLVDHISKFVQYSTQAHTLIEISKNNEGFFEKLKDRSGIPSSGSFCILSTRRSFVKSRRLPRNLTNY
jgi:hypothetical protein